MSTLQKLYRASWVYLKLFQLLTFIAVILSFWILGHEKFIKVICVVCSFHLVKFALSSCLLLLFRNSIFLCYLASNSHVFLCRYELGFTPNWNKVDKWINKFFLRSYRLRACNLSFFISLNLSIAIFENF